MVVVATTSLPAWAAEKPWSYADHAGPLIRQCAAEAARPAAQPVFKLPPIPGNVVLQQDVQYGQAGDTRLLLDILRPKADSPKPRPVILFIHGGGWAGGDKVSALGALVPYAASGQYFCASANYRLTGEAPWPAQLDDCKAAVRWLKANAGKYNIDPEKIGVWGHSAGGHLVSMLGLTGNQPQLEGRSGSPGPNSRVACVVDFAGPSDMIAFVTFFEGKRKSKTPSGGLAKLFGEPLDQWREVARRASPSSYVAAGAPQFLIAHGTADPLVPLAQAEELYAALQKAGSNVVLVKIVGGGHGIGGKEVSERVRAFFDKYLRGENVQVSAAPIEVPPAPAKK
jgi:acetyl esterase/lipase